MSSDTVDLLPLLSAFMAIAASQAEQIAALKDENTTLKALVFGSRSERTAVVIQGQLDLEFGDLGPPAPANDGSAQAPPAPSRERRKARRNLGRLPLHLPRIDEILEPVINDDRFAEAYEAWENAADRFLQELTITRRLSTPVNFIVHAYGDVNDQLAHGRPFFADIARDGIVLYEAPGFPLAEPKTLAPAEVLAEARRHFDHWFPRAAHRFELAQEALKRGYDREAAFDLHQATERFYHCALLLLTLHSPLCRARHNGLYAARRTMPKAMDSGSFARGLGRFRAA